MREWWKSFKTKGLTDKQELEAQGVYGGMLCCKKKLKLEYELGIKD